MDHQAFYPGDKVRHRLRGNGTIKWFHAYGYYTVLWDIKPRQLQRQTKVHQNTLTLINRKDPDNG